MKTFGNFDELIIYSYSNLINLFVLNLSLSDLSHCKLINKYSNNKKHSVMKRTILRAFVSQVWELYKSGLRFSKIRIAMR